jgi:hypothetical protein
VFDVRKLVSDRRKDYPELVSLTFASAQKFAPLQAADLLAWKYYQFANDILRGDAVPGEPKRKNMRKMIQTKRFRLQSRSRKDIEASVTKAQENAVYISRLANAFLTGEDEPI